VADDFQIIADVEAAKAEGPGLAASVIGWLAGGGGLPSLTRPFAGHLNPGEALGLTGTASFGAQLTVELAPPPCRGQHAVLARHKKPSTRYRRAYSPVDRKP
jgi:hypothetical protein